MQMVTHGTITGLLFLLVGIVYDKAHTRYIPDLGGHEGDFARAWGKARAEGRDPAKDPVVIRLLDERSAHTSEIRP